MQAVILAGGKGTRLRPLTYKIPKPMVPIGNTPFLEILIKMLKEKGFNDFIICTGYLREHIENHFRDGSSLGVRIRYSPDKTEPSDTGDAIRGIKNMVDDIFFVFNGDTYLDIDYRKAYEQFLSSNKTAMMIAYDNSYRKLADSNLHIDPSGLVLEYNKDSPREEFTHVDAGVQVYRKSVFRLFPEEDTISLEKHVFPEIIKRGEMLAFPIQTRFFDIGTPERLETFKKFWEERA